MFNTEDVGVFLGLDVGKSAHHGHGLTPAGKKVFDKPLPNSEPKLRAVFDKLAAKFATVLVIVDQPASIGALPLAVTWLLERYGSPAALRKAGRRRLVELIRPKAPRMAARLIDDVFTALDEQTVVVPGTGTLDIVVPSLARSLAAVQEQRRALEAQINTLLEAHPLSPVLTSMPGVGVRTAAVLLTTVGDGTSFPTAAHLASYAGLAPTTKSSGTSIHGEHAPRGGNRQLKRAMFLSAFACMNADAASRTYYDKQRARGKTHTQALLRLARQRISVLFAMLRDGTFYEPRTPETAPA